MRMTPIGTPPVSANGNGHSTPPSQATNGQRPTANTTARSTRQSIGLVRYAHLIGWGMAVPERIVTNDDLSAVVETNDEWIRSRTGIQERRFASERETATTLGLDAARHALDRADVLPSEIELIIVATSTPENFYPSTASLIQNQLGVTHAGAFDLSAACSGFVYAVNMAAQAIRSGSITTALVIGSEVNSRVMDWSDRGTCVLFGDGAGAIVLRGSDEPGGILSCVLGSDGSGGDLLGIPTVGHGILADGVQLHKLHMDGREVFRFAVHVIQDSIREALDKAGLTLADVSLVVPHQANQRILSAAARSLNLPEAIFYSNVHKYGNMSAASIPVALCEAEKDGRIKPNDRLIFIGFGGGLTWGTMVIQWDGVTSKATRGLPTHLLRGRRQAEYAVGFWRGNVMRIFRRAESWVRGPAVRLSNVRRNTGNRLNQATGRTSKAAVPNLNSTNGKNPSRRTK